MIFSMDKWLTISNSDGTLLVVEWYYLRLCCWSGAGMSGTARPLGIETVSKEADFPPINRYPDRAI
jgi:hypothetical protein